MQDAVSVHGEQVDDLPEARRDLAADDKQRFPEDRRLSLDELFQSGLGRHATRDKRNWLVIDALQANFHRHKRPSALRSKQAVLRTRRERISENPGPRPRSWCMRCTLMIRG